MRQINVILSVGCGLVCACLHAEETVQMIRSARIRPHVAKVLRPGLPVSVRCAFSLLHRLYSQGRQHRAGYRVDPRCGRDSVALAKPQLAAASGEHSDKTLPATSRPPFRTGRISFYSKDWQKSECAKRRVQVEIVPKLPVAGFRSRQAYACIAPPWQRLASPSLFTLSTYPYR